ncbi:acyltransferase, partial [Shigella flexneri]
FEIDSLLLITSVIILSLLAVKLFDEISPIQLVDHGRNNQIDGMRGFLAIFVLIHHAAIWHGYLLTGVWKTPSSNLLTNLGQVGVSFFFMITGYLFFSKIRSSDQDWVRLYISRFLRLTPMFIVSLCLVLLVIGFKSRWSVHVSPASLTVSLMRWAPFTALGMPNINGVKDSFTINAAVTWTLVYEWFFYFSLPVIAALFKRRVSIHMIIISVLVLVIFLCYPSKKIHVISFLFGLLASYSNNYVHRVAKAKITPIMIIALLSYEMIYFPTTYAPLPLIICGVCFILIASGCDFYGILRLNLTRKLGETTYSIYLLHGVFLYCVMTWVIPSNYSNYFFIMLISITAFCVTLLSCITFKLIELPFINITKQTAMKIRGIIKNT